MNKTALVTGASRGIGRQIATHFAEAGYRLVLVAKNEGPLRDLSDSLARRYGVRTYPVAVDLCAYEEVRTRVGAVLRELGQLDVLVNSAGIFRFGTSTLAVDDLEAVLATNVMAAHNLCSLSLAALRTSERAHVFNVSSITGVEGFAPIGGYAASKFALVGYGQCLAKELLSENIRVTTLCPDVVATDMAAGSGLTTEEMITPSDLSATIAYVMALSPAAIVDQITIRCKTILLRTEARKTGAI